MNGNYKNKDENDDNENGWLWEDEVWTLVF